MMFALFEAGYLETAKNVGFQCRKNDVLFGLGVADHQA